MASARRSPERPVARTATSPSRSPVGRIGDPRTRSVVGNVTMGIGCRQRSSGDGVWAAHRGTALRGNPPPGLLARNGQRPAGDRRSRRHRRPIGLAHPQPALAGFSLARSSGPGNGTSEPELHDHATLPMRTAGRISPGRCSFLLLACSPRLCRFGVGDLLFGFGHQEWAAAVDDYVLVDDALAHVLHRRDLVHHVEQHFLDGGAQAAGAGLALLGLAGGRLERLVGEGELDVVEGEELLVLLDDRVLRLDQDPLQLVPAERIERDA